MIAKEFDEQLTVRVDDAGRMKEEGKNIPCVEIAPGINMFCDIMFQSGQNRQWRRHITKSMMEDMGYELKELVEHGLRCAVKNRPPVLLSYSENAMGEENLLFAEEPLPHIDGMYILTTQDFLLGAVALFYPGVQERLSILMGGNYYAIPSSLHEFIILPQDEVYTIEFLNHMLRSANREVVEPEDVLTDTVYYYDSRKGDLLPCTDGESNLGQGEEDRIVPRERQGKEIMSSASPADNAAENKLEPHWIPAMG